MCVSIHFQRISFVIREGTGTSRSLNFSERKKKLQKTFNFKGVDFVRPFEVSFPYVFDIFSGVLVLKVTSEGCVRKLPDMCLDIIVCKV